MTMLDLGPRGQQLWQQVLDQDVVLQDESNPRRQIALDAARCADTVDRFEAWAKDEQPVIEVKNGFATNPVFIELRQQRLTLARLISALRLPDEATGRRAQNRTGVRGAYGGTVTALDRMKKAAG